MKKGSASSPTCNIGITEANRKAVAKILNALLADEYTLYTKTLNFHWNVVGPWFGPLHALFKDQYEALFTIVDDIAERVRSLQGTSAGSMAEFIKLARLKEMPGEIIEDRTMLKALLEDHEAIIRTMRNDLEACIEKYEDAGTNNFLTDIMEKHEKIAWMLRAHLRTA